MIGTLDEVCALVPLLQDMDETIVTTCGCFDVVHAGHAWYLNEAAKKGLLFVGVNSDKSPYFATKPGRPIVPEQERLELLDGLRSVCGVFLYDSENPIPWLERIKPDYHVKCTDPTYGREQCVEWDTVVRNGGEVVLLPKREGLSTTSLIDRILRVYGRSPQGLKTS